MIPKDSERQQNKLVVALKNKDVYPKHYRSGFSFISPGSVYINLWRISPNISILIETYWIDNIY